MCAYAWIQVWFVIELLDTPGSLEHHRLIVVRVKCPSTTSVVSKKGPPNIEEKRECCLVL